MSNENKYKNAEQNGRDKHVTASKIWCKRCTWKMCVQYGWDEYEHESNGME